MNIVYTCDNNYVWLMGISMISLFENNFECSEIIIFLLGDEISSENKINLKQICKKYNRIINITDIPDLDIPKNLCNQRWPKSAYTRLFAGELLPNDIEKVLYLDCDTIINGSLSELWDINISNYIVYGVKDCISKMYKKNIGLGKFDPYINAGVLLINIEKLRKINISDRINEFLQKYSKIMNYSDQDVLNGVLYSSVSTLAAKYNVMTITLMYEYKEVLAMRHPTNYYSRNEIEKAKNDPIIIHFTTCMTITRPWFQNSKNPYTQQFEIYKELSHWKNKQLYQEENGSLQNKILTIICKLPKKINIHIIGFIHSILKPFCLRIKNHI